MHSQQTNFSPHRIQHQNGSKTLKLAPPVSNQGLAGNGKHKLGILNSWKEIAAYLGRGIRTVQRWESELRLPVHRPKGKNRSAVLAFRDEIDDWLHQTPAQLDNKETRDALTRIAYGLQDLAQRLVALSNPETQPKGEKLLASVNMILGELEQKNGDSPKSRLQPSPFFEEI